MSHDVYRRPSKASALIATVAVGLVLLAVSGGQAAAATTPTSQARADDRSGARRLGEQRELGWRHRPTREPGIHR